MAPEAYSRPLDYTQAIVILDGVDEPLLFPAERFPAHLVPNGLYLVAIGQRIPFLYRLAWAAGGCTWIGCLLGIFLFMSLLIMAGADLRVDLKIILVGMVGGLVIQSWGTADQPVALLHRRTASAVDHPRLADRLAGD